MKSKEYNPLALYSFLTELQSEHSKVNDYNNSIMSIKTFENITNKKIGDWKDKITGILEEYPLDYIKAIKYSNGKLYALYLDENKELVSFENANNTVK